MKLIFTIIISIIVYQSVSAQERTISGRLTSTEDGSPLPGINISIKGTNTGTTTDADGYYSIKVPVGATLVFSFIGMQTREVVVTENNLLPASSGKKQQKGKRKSKSLPVTPIPRSLYQDSLFKNETGVAVLTEETPVYNNKSDVDPAAIRAIKQRGSSYVIKADTDPVRRSGLALQFSTSLGLEKVNKLPSFQTQYAQGRTNGSSLQWAGADQQEIFSWGPLIRTLEFDGTNYPFDKNGMLVPSGNGNGEPARHYDALSFFRTGIVNVNELTLTMPAPKNGVLVFDLENRTRSGIIPNSHYKKLNLTSSIKNFKVFRHIQANASLSFNRSTGDLLNRGANLASIIGSVYRTPVTFDNTNASSPGSAINSPESYQLPDGTKRSHAPGLTDNPYGLINKLPDNEELHRLIATANLQYDNYSSPFTFVFNGNIDRQWNNSVFGIPPGYSAYANGRFTNRDDHQTFASAILTSNYHYYPYNSELNLRLSYQAEHTGRELDRMDGFNFLSGENFGNLSEADSLVALNKSTNRTSQEIIINADYEYDNWLNIQLANRNYFSNTIHNNRYVNLFPSGSLSIDFASLLDLGPVHRLKLYTTASRTLREAPLLYSNWSYGSVNMPVENYSKFYESTELFFDSGIAPETEWKFETGVKFNANRFSAEVSYFNNMTNDFILPVNTSTGFQLTNSAAVKNTGGLISAGYVGYTRNGDWGIDIRWSRYNSVVKELYSPDEWLPIAGFQPVQTVLAKGKPVGAIYGTTYARNSEGQKIIGNDGFPVKDNNLKMIGNPIPDWILGWSSFIEWKQLKLTFLFDFKKGGDAWNGTNSMLDYLGRSSNTGDLRTTANYVFEGVDVDGNTNVIPVDFYNPSDLLTNNRWVRYGWDGVGEDYIEDTSWIRLSELVISYSIEKYNSTIKNIKFSLVGRNLFLITPYSGVDPAASLFGYNTTNGLDIFNTPSIRSYSAQITIKI